MPHQLIDGEGFPIRSGEGANGPVRDLQLAFLFPPSLGKLAFRLHAIDHDCPTQVHYDPQAANAAQCPVHHCDLYAVIIDIKNLLGTIDIVIALNIPVNIFARHVHKIEGEEYQHNF
jgi:hypothetical protein